MQQKNYWILKFKWIIKFQPIQKLFLCVCYQLISIKHWGVTQINHINLTVTSVIDPLSRFFHTTRPKQGPGAALLNLSVTYGQLAMRVFRRGFLILRRFVIATALMFNTPQQHSSNFFRTCLRFSDFSRSNMLSIYIIDNICITNIINLYSKLRK